MWFTKRSLALYVQTIKCLNALNTLREKTERAYSPARRVSGSSFGDLNDYYFKFNVVSSINKKPNHLLFGFFVMFDFLIKALRVETTEKTMQNLNFILWLCHIDVNDFSFIEDSGEEKMLKADGEKLITPQTDLRLWCKTFYFSFKCSINCIKKPCAAHAVRQLAINNFNHRLFHQDC